MLKNAWNIEQNINQILVNHNYQSEDPSLIDTYIATGVNWGYVESQLAQHVDPMLLLTIAILLLIIIFTGYLIIYNVFQVSVTNDIRYYGLLKTIGTTGRQIKRMVRQQAWILSLFGIPLGLLTGYGIGCVLTPFVLLQLDGIQANTTSTNPIIFLIAAVFAFLTIHISCRRPCRIAANVSPIEAVRYTEKVYYGRSAKKSNERMSLPQMAWANLGRSRSKTAITILSLSLSILLLHLTFTFTNSFDMNKYLSKMVSDFIIADAHYFKIGEFWSADYAISEDIISAINKQSGMEGGGRVYGKSSAIEAFVTETDYRDEYADIYSPETLEQNIAQLEKNEDGLLPMDIQLYGMERYVLDQLKVVAGDISKLYDSSQPYIAAVYMENDYGVPKMDSHWANVGDAVTLRYIDEYEFYDLSTGSIIDPQALPEDAGYGTRPKTYHDVTYEVAVLVSIPYSLSYRYYSLNEFVLNDQVFRADSDTENIMYYSFDSSDASMHDMENFISAYTATEMPQLDYESKGSYAAAFESLQNTFLFTGGMLSIIVGLVGILNFLNAILTSIFTRSREFAMLQSIGMTNGQLKQMLIWEGLYYTLGAVLISSLCCLISAPMLSHTAERILWFLSYRFSPIPLLVMTPVFTILGVIIPLVLYRVTARKSLIERLRETE